MTKQELRLGNLVKCGEQIIIVTGITQNQINAKNIDSDYECGYDLDMLEAIPLNEEWLLQFAFEKKNPPPFIHHIYFAHYGDRHQIFFNGEDWSISSTTVKYVHELQNVFFALYKKELLFHALTA